ncbi:MFS transporter [Methylobacterium sp. AMS5]|uniref:MFS transporter n=1 Tax=Methylobacterium sp. AMS5 TaxID=925818 RepID=UPI0011875F2A|nr:MFS transporter [Methylobacterium sp. AMS5]
MLSVWWAPNFGFAISFVIAAMGLAAIAILKIRYAISPPSDGPLSTVRESFTTLKTLAFGDVYFRVGLCASLLQSFVLGLYDPMLTIILKDQGLNASAFGIVVSATAVGALVGAILFKRLFKRKWGIALTSLSLSGFGGSVFIPGLLGIIEYRIPLPVFAILWAVNGLCYALAAMNFAVILQSETPRAQIGTVSSTIRSVQLLLLVTAPLAGSAFTALIGVSGVFAFCGVVTLFFAAVLGWWSSVRRLDPSPSA